MTNICILLWDLPGGSGGKESAYNAGDQGLIPGSGRSPGEGNGKPIPVFLSGKSHGQKSLAGYSAWVAKSWTQLSECSTTDLHPPKQFELKALSDYAMIVVGECFTSLNTLA